MNFLRHLTLQSKLIAILLSVCLLTALPIAYIGYSSGRAAIREGVVNQLIGQREIRMNQCVADFDVIKDQARSLADSRDSIEALSAFSKKFHDIEANAASVSPEVADGLKEFYEKSFLPALAANSDGVPTLESLYPKAGATQSLQYAYIAKTPDAPYGAKMAVDTSPLAGAYDDVHRQFHPVFAKFATAFEFEDLLLTDAEGNLVYTAQKTLEFGTSLIDGPYANSSLGRTAGEPKFLHCSEI